MGVSYVGRNYTQSEKGRSVATCYWMPSPQVDGRTPGGEPGRGAGQGETRGGDRALTGFKSTCEPHLPRKTDQIVVGLPKGGESDAESGNTPSAPP